MQTPPSPKPSFVTRVGLAFSLFFRVLFDTVFAGRALRLRADASPEPQPAPEPSPEPSKLHTAPAESALQLLGLLQREGRLMDFLMEDMDGYSDSDVGAAARVVHDQCRKALQAHLTLEHIRPEAEGSRVSVAAGFSASEVRLVGQVAGQAPFVGVLTHAGWRALSLTLPQLSEGHDVHVLAPAEVEL